MERPDFKDMLDDIIMEASEVTQENADEMVSRKLDDLQVVLKAAKNPEKWAETYWRSAKGFVGMIDSVINILAKMK